MRGQRWHAILSVAWRRDTVMALVMVATFTLLALITRLACIDQDGYSSFWPANAALVVAFLVLPPRHCVLAALLCFIANIALNTLTSYTLTNSIGFSALNVAVSLVCARLTRSYCGALTDLSRFRRLASFALMSFAAAALEAAVGESVYYLCGKPVSLPDWLQWSFCDGLGFLLATPAILLAVKSGGTEDLCDARPFERWGLLLGTAGLTAVSFTNAHSPMFVLIYPALVLTAFRAGPHWVLASVLLTAILSSAMTAHGFGPLALLSLNGASLKQDMVQPYIISLFLSAVPANNALGEKRRAARRLKQAKSAVEHHATHDPLTTLANRTLFQRSLKATRQAGAWCAVLFIDLDRFKQINDNMGHHAGDELLRGFSSRVLGLVGPEVTVARFGGDEFAVLVTSKQGRVDLDALCENIVRVAKAPFFLSQGAAFVSASIGVAQACDQAEPDELMRQADLALYAAKAAGRNGYRFFSADLDRAATERAELEADLRTALSSGQGLSLHYQPKLNRHGTITSVEALLRWRHPRQGPIAPNVVVAMAEETGLIIPLGTWVLREAIGFAERWPELNVAVNISPVQLQDAGFVESTLAILASSSVAASRVELEVTETTLMNDLAVATGRLIALRRAGLKIALDDFGTGFSSLQYLQDLAVDRIKIDQSFVRRLGESAEAVAIVKAVVQLGHAMGLQVTAEGVETEAHHQFLLAADVDEMQGYLFSKPVCESSVGAVLAKRLEGESVAA